MSMPLRRRIGKKRKTYKDRRSKVQNLRKLVEKARDAAIAVLSEEHTTGINDGLLGRGEDTCVTVF
jgi:hypothetical protein